MTDAGARRDGISEIKGVGFLLKCAETRVYLWKRHMIFDLLKMQPKKLCDILKEYFKLTSQFVPLTRPRGRISIILPSEDWSMSLASRQQ